MILLPKVSIRGLDRQTIFVQGGMGAGISLAPLAGAVAKRGGVGVVSFVALNWFVSRRLGYKVMAYPIVWTVSWHLIVINYDL